MTKNSIALIFVIAMALVSCSANNSAEKTQADTVKSMTTVQHQLYTTDSLLVDTVKVKQWLTTAIERYFEFYFSDIAVRKIFTDDYYSYKLDAINLCYDIGDSMAWKKKWQNKYDTKSVGYGGFLISGQDWGKIEVTRCVFLRHAGHDASFYKVEITDFITNKRTYIYNRDIKVITYNSKLLIDDVIEYD